MSQHVMSPSTDQPRAQRRGTLRRIVVALLAALTGLTLVPSTATAADQVLTWTAGNSVTDYLTVPDGAVAGTATVIFDNSVDAGNTTGMPHTLTFDTSTPGYNHDVDLNIVANPYDANGGYYEAEITLTPGTYRYFCAIPGHGMMVGELVVTDGGGGEPDPDTTAPEVSAEVTGEQDADGNYIATASVTLTATDADSGVDTVEYSLDGGEYTTYDAPITVDTLGEHTVGYRATDVAGNTGEGSVSFTVVEEGGGEPDPDTTAPVVSAEVTGEQDADGNYLGSASVTISATDADSGVDTVEYSLDGGEFTAYSAPVVVDELGEHTLDYRATDVAGNTGEGSVTLTIVEEGGGEPDPDTTAPDVSAQVTGEQDADGNYIGSASVSITATDADSGVEMIEYAVDGGEYTHYHAAITLSEVGEHTVDFRATDVAGNIAEGSVTLTIVEEGGGEPGPDITAPEVSAEVTGEQDADGNYIATASVTLTATDADSGVDTVEYSLDGGEFTAYSAPVVVDELGEHTLDYRATDVAGNTGEGSIAFTVVEEGGGEPDPDTTAPEVSAEVTGEQDADGNYIATASVTLTATDADSGVDTVEYSLDGGEYTTYDAPITVDTLGEHTVDFRATDVAGNTGEGSVTLTIVEEAGGEPGDCSDTRATVVVGDIDTGVGNADIGDGCTINDVIDEDGDHATHGHFVRHVVEVVRPLADDGVITHREAGMIIQVAARSDVGK
ncbi:OmpL47-type beta-barrel domain-containing protein [Georgenia sp. H159]|uniref:OmpL47-type beta-barrel domain-containing protein n=1 Tax=Georgenia sp. H159 TaxID=3076115 RepID=UPI002D79ED9C|nr:plastocyanin/azurin family copper-binding protein [Georgenia sp. H159]